MIGEIGIFHNKPYNISLSCESQIGHLWAIRRRDFIAIRETAPEEFRKIQDKSDEMEARMNKSYIQKLQHVVSLKTSKNKKDIDIKRMTKGIMLE